MDDEKFSSPEPTSWILFAGLQAGVLGGLAMMAVLFLNSLLHHKSGWTIANLYGTTLYGNRAMQRGFGMAALSGIALRLLECGTVGVIFAVLFARQRLSPFRFMMIGVTAGLANFYISQHILWAWINPLVPFYSPHFIILLSYLLFGLFLGRTPHYLAEIAKA